jgi:FkbM family methyltransferase
MLINLEELAKNYSIKPRNVLHIGGHEGEEASDYENSGVELVSWIEALPDKVKVMRSKLDPQRHVVIEGAAWETTGKTITLNVASFSQASSIFAFDESVNIYPSLRMSHQISVSTVTADSLYKSHRYPDFINLDIQGAELEALKGSVTTLKYTNYVYTEVSRKVLYKGGAHVKELDNFLRGFGFKRVTTRWMWLEGWGDALYIKKESLNISFRQSFSQRMSRISWDTKQLIYLIRINLHKLRKDKF